jgi:hypothetical protein
MRQSLRTASYCNALSGVFAVALSKTDRLLVHMCYGWAAFHYGAQSQLDAHKEKRCLAMLQL